MSEKERIVAIIESFINCKGECKNCFASQKIDGIVLCNLLADYRNRLFDAITEIIEKM